MELESEGLTVTPHGERCQFGRKGVRLSIFPRFVGSTYDSTAAP